MSFGGGSSTPPAPQAQIPVPQSDDPRPLEAQRKEAQAAKSITGSMLAHLLTGERGLLDTADVQPKRLVGSSGAKAF